MEHVLSYKNLGKIVHYTGSSEPNIRNRINEMNVDYYRLTVMWDNPHAGLEHKLTLFRYYKAIMDYGSELWKLTAGNNGTQAIIRSETQWFNMSTESKAKFLDDISVKTKDLLKQHISWFMVKGGAASNSSNTRFDAWTKGTRGGSFEVCHSKCLLFYHDFVC